LELLRYSSNPYNISRLTIAAGLAALSPEGREYYGECCKRIQETREHTKEALEEMGFLVLPSRSNFLFVRHTGIKGETLYQELRRRGVLIRHFSQERIAEYNRITIGTPEEMQRLLAAVKEILA